MDIEDLAIVKPHAIISASRRTDIPGLYMRSFKKSMENGYIDVPNPRFPEKIYRISLDPKDVKCIAWWSKNYGPWIKMYSRYPDLFKRYSAHYFNFTINSDCELEHLPVTLNQRLDQLQFLIDEFGVDAVNYRFDPIVYYHRIGENQILNNLDQFEYIMSEINEIGIQEISFSFCEAYPQVVANMRKCGKELLPLTKDQKRAIVAHLSSITAKYNIEMKSCCDPNLGVNSSTCISLEKIDRLLGENLRSRRKDPGQRKECNCVITRDVGSYDQECKHGCDYCYANPRLHISQ